MDQPDAIWRYAPLSEHSVPSVPVTRAIRRAGRLWRATRSAVGLDDDLSAEREELSRPDDRVLEKLVPRFEVEKAVEALASALGDWPTGRTGADRVRVVVGPPGSGVGSVVAGLAARRGWRSLEPPPRPELLQRPSVAREVVSGLGGGDDTPAVIDRLERWVLRDARMLPTVRWMLDALPGLPSPVLVGCDSWAWSFLDRALGAGDYLGAPWALAAFDGRALDCWLGAPMRAAGVICRPTDERKDPVFGSVEEEGTAECTQERPVSRALSRLASAARGNPGIALELWRRGLQLEGGGEEVGGERTVWTSPLRDVEEVVPARLERIRTFILHAILLHGGLDRGTLLEVLPFPAHDLLGRVRELAQRRLVEETEGELSISATAYGAVRDHLASGGFLIDGF